MLMRLLFAAPDDESLKLMHSVLDSALCLTPLDIHVTDVRAYNDLMAKIDAKQVDIILLDWQIAGSETPGVVRAILNDNPTLRVVVLLPEQQRQYRQLVWDAGACSGVPKEHMDQEWFSTMLCLMYRAMQREAS